MKSIKPIVREIVSAEDFTCGEADFVVKYSDKITIKGDHGEISGEILHKKTGEFSYVLKNKEYSSFSLAEIETPLVEWLKAQTREYHRSQVLFHMGKLGFSEVMTGGNCTAFQIDFNDDSTYLMVTVADDCSAPDYLTDPVCVGLHDENGMIIYENFNRLQDFIDRITPPPKEPEQPEPKETPSFAAEIFKEMLSNGNDIDDFDTYWRIFELGMISRGEEESMVGTMKASVREEVEEMFNSSFNDLLP